jgi:hypothetical protein
MGGKVSACSISVGEPEGNRPLGRSRPRGENNIEMDLKATGRGME